MRKIITFYDLSKDFTNIEIEFANWLLFNLNVNVVLFENDSIFSNNRKIETELFKNNLFLKQVQIINYNNFSEYTTLLDSSNFGYIITKINYDENIINYFKLIDYM